MLETDINKGAYTIRRLFTDHAFLIPEQRDYELDDASILLLVGNLLVEYREIPEETFSGGCLLAFPNDEGKMEVLDGQTLMPTYFLMLRALDDLLGRPPEGYRFERQYFKAGSEIPRGFVTLPLTLSALQDPPAGLSSRSYASIQHLTRAYNTMATFLKKELPGTSGHPSLTGFRDYFLDQVTMTFYEADGWRDVYRL